MQKKHWKMRQARRESVLQLTENHETLIRRASEQVVFARTMECGQLYIAIESGMY